MGKIIKAKTIKIEKLETPRIARFKNSKNEWYNVEYHYNVEIQFDGQSRSSNCVDLVDALKYVELNSEVYSPSWEEVTCNGRFSCD